MLTATPIAVSSFDLDLTLRSGQCFRYRREGDSFVVLDRDRVFRFRQEGDQLDVEGDVPAATRLLGLDSDHDAALRIMSADRHLAPLLDRYGGMRVMRQDPWQCLVSFVCSACSNIPRITGNVNGIAEAFGEAKDGERAFPAPGPLPPRALKPIKLGFREKYIQQLFCRVTDEWLEALEGKSFDHVRDQLVLLPGVGIKVAECVMAFSLGFGEACPVDVWIRRLARKLYFRNRKTSDRKIAERLRKMFGPHTALAQQVMFAAGRDGLL